MTQKKQKTQHVDDALAAGRRLREAREHAGLSQRALAGDDCTAAYISRLELGERIPSIQLLRQLEKRLGVSADFIATGATESSGRESLLVEAEAARRLSDLETARSIYRRVLGDQGADDASCSAALTGLGKIALTEGDPAEAIGLLRSAIDAVGLDPVELPDTADALARAYAIAGELSASIALLERCVVAYRDADDPIQYIRFATMLGYALTDNGDLAAAERVVAEALARGDDVPDFYTRARLYWSQARLLGERGRAAAAERYARKTLDTLRATDDDYALAHAIEMLARIKLDLGKVDQAVELLDEGEGLIQRAGSPQEIAHFQLERARALARLGEREQSAALAMELAGAFADAQPVARGRAYGLLADLFVELDERERAQEIYELAIDCLERQPPSTALTSAYRGLSALFKEKGRTDEALELLERALATQAALPESSGALQRT